MEKAGDLPGAEGCKTKKKQTETRPHSEWNQSFIVDYLRIIGNCR
jgi:hypothetical protein